MKNSKQRYFLFYNFQSQKAEAAIRVVLYKKVFLEISQNSQENTCVCQGLFFFDKLY